jgi:hypothetical protein
MGIIEIVGYGGRSTSQSGREITSGGFGNVENRGNPDSVYCAVTTRESAWNFL